MPYLEWAVRIPLRRNAGKHRRRLVVRRARLKAWGKRRTMARRRAEQAQQLKALEAYYDKTGRPLR